MATALRDLTVAAIRPRAGNDGGDSFELTIHAGPAKHQTSYHAALSTAKAAALDAAAQTLAPDQTKTQTNDRNHGKDEGISF